MGWHKIGITAAWALLLAACGGGGGGGGATAPAAPLPAKALGVLSTSLPEGAIAVRPTTDLTVTFDTTIGGPASTTPVVTVSDGVANVPVTVKTDVNALVIKPISRLKLRTTYTVTIKAGLTADNGSTLAQDYTLSFRTVAALYVPKPLVPAVPGFRGSITPRLAGGDIDGDGRPDLVQLGRLLDPGTAALPPPGYTLLVYAQNATGGMDQVQRLDHALPAANVSVDFENLVLLDIDGDQRPEILVSQHHMADPLQTGLQVFKRDSAGVFRPHDFIASPYFRAMVVTDLDGDGRADLLGGSLAGFRAFLNPGAGLTAMAAVPASVSGATLAVGDLDRDGRPDLLVSHTYPPAGTQAQTVYAQATPGVFTVHEALTQAVGLTCAGFSRCQDPVMIDIDGDGWLDLIHGSATDATGTRSAAFLRQAGAGFVAGFEASYGLGTNIFAVVDADGDGLADLLSINNTMMGVGMGQRKPTFEYSVAFEFPFFDTIYAGSAVVMDLNGDGRPDVVANSVNEGITAMIYTGP